MHEAMTGPFAALLDKAGSGDRQALDEAFALLYPTLRGIARRQMGGEGSQHTLQATALVGETYLKLMGDRKLAWNDHRHFLGLAARAMRQVLVDHARARDADKRGGGLAKLTLSAADDFADPLANDEDPEIDFVALDRALAELERCDHRQASVVQLRYFGGLSIDETAAALDISPATVKRDWTLARLWLLRSLGRMA